MFAVKVFVGGWCACVEFVRVFVWGGEGEGEGVGEDVGVRLNL